MVRRKLDRLEQLLAEVQRAIAFDYPKLAAKAAGSQVIIEGELSITPLVEEYVGSGQIATYKVRIQVLASYPTAEPKVFETGGAFPHTADFHCNESGDCCICVFETWRATADDTSFTEYLNGPIRNFFLSQHIKKETGEWPFGEWAHGREGYLDACADRLGCDRNFETVDYFLRVLSQPWPKGHWPCPCGSGKKTRHCCVKNLRALAEKVRPSEAMAMRKRLLGYFR